MKYLWSGLAAGLLSASHAGAVEFIETDQTLNDDHFYRAVACGAAPGADCTRQFARWPAEKARELTVSLRGIDPEFPVYKLSWVRAALDEAIDEINKAGAAINLVRRADALPADIPIFLTAQGAEKWCKIPAITALMDRRLRRVLSPCGGGMETSRRQRLHLAQMCAGALSGLFCSKNWFRPWALRPIFEAPPIAGNPSLTKTATRSPDLKVRTGRPFAVIIRQTVRCPSRPAISI